MLAPQPRAMGPWEAQVRDYLAFRRKLGFTLRTPSDELVLFARHLERSDHRGPLTNEVTVAWASSASGATRKYWASRIAAIRPFAKHLAAVDASHQVPPTYVFGRRLPRPNPHIYTATEIRQLLDVTRTVKPVHSLPPITYRTLFGLLASTGMRCGEALKLRREHVDLKEGRLLIAHGKLGKSRVIPMHPSTCAALKEYAARRDHEFPRGPKSDAFFLSRRATTLQYQSVNITFRMLRRALGWKQSPRPRLHDLRHAFAVRNLIRWSAEGKDVDNKIAALTTYLGHASVTATYWYFTAVPELMEIAGRRFEAFARRASR